MFIGRTHGDIHDYYRIGKQIGAGDCGDMRLVVHKETQVQRCLKTIVKNKVSIDEKKQLLEEYKCMKELVSQPT